MSDPTLTGAPAAPEKSHVRGFQIPDTRGWIAISLVCLTAMIFAMIYVKPELTQNQGFMFLAQSVIVSGLIGGVVAFLYSASKASTDTRAQVGQALDKLPDAQP